MKTPRLFKPNSLLATVLTVLAAFLTIFAAPSTWAATYTWTGGAGNGNFANAANWSSGGPPNSTSDIGAFNSTGGSQGSMYMSGDVSINGLTFAASTPTISWRLATSPSAGTAKNLTIGGTSPAITVASGMNNNITIGVGGGSIIMSSSLTVTHNGSGTVTFNQPITGAFGISKTGTGTLTLSDSGSSFGTATAGLTVSGGTVKMGSGTYSSGNSTGVLLTVNTGGTFDLNDNNIQVGNFTGTGGSVLNNGTTAKTFTIGGNNTGGGNFQGAIADNNNAGGGTVALTKVGSASITLSGANTYSGDTTISAGTLALTSGGTLPNTPNITIASGATFDISAPTTALTLGSSQTLKTSATGANTTATVTSALNKSLTLGGTTTGLEFTAYGGANGSSSVNAPLTVAGTAGGLVLNSKPIKVTTSAALGAGPYKLVAKSGSATVAGTPGTLTVAGSGLASGATAALSVSSGELILTISHSVTFNNNGGSGTMAAQTGVYNTTAALTANSFTRVGYTFAGWNTAADGTGTAYANGANYTFTASTTLYAQWTINNYNVSYDLNGGTGTTPSTQNGNYNTTITAATQAGFSRAGYSFSGWNTAANGSGTAVAAGGSYTIPANNTTLFAQWTLAAVPTKLVVTVVPSGTTPAGNTFSVTVQAQDNGGTPGNVSSDTTIQLAASGSGTLAGNTATIPSGLGLVTLSGVTYTKAEAITLTAAATSGDALATSVPSASFTIINSTLNAGNSTAVASPATGTANGVAASTVTVTLRDAYNNLLGAGTNVSWTVTGTGNTVTPASSGTTSAGGVATFTVKSTTVETKTVTVNVGATVITSTLQISFLTETWSATPADANWGTPGNWVTGFSPVAGDLVYFDASSQLSPNLETAYSVNSVTFNSGAGSYTIGGSTLTLTGSGVTNNSTSTQTLNVPVAMSTAQTINAASGNITLGGAVSGNVGLTKAGAGAVTLSGTSTYTGNTTINGGPLTIGGSGSLGAGVYAGNITNNSSFTFASATSQTNSGIISGNGSVTNSGNLTLSGNNTYTGGTTINNGGVLQVGAGSSSGSIASTSAVTNNGALVYNRTGTLTAGYVISGTGNLTNLGSGTVVLNNANTFSGSTTINAGTLSLGNLSALSGTAGITMASGTTLQSTIAGTGAAGVTLAAPITTSGNVTINAPTTALGSQAFNEFTLNGAIGGSGNVTFNNVNNVNQIFTVTLGAQCTYSGNTLLDNTAGTAGQIIVRLGTHNALPPTTVVTIDGRDGAGGGRCAEINLNGFNQRLAGLTNITRTLRPQRVVNSDVSAPATLTISNTVDYTFSGQLGNSFNQFSVSPSAMAGSANGNNLGLTKDGPGTFTLAAGNTYIGNTIISNGTLALASGGNISGSANIIVGTEPGSPAVLNVTAAGITIGAAQTLRGHGTVQGVATIAGTLTPGNSTIGTLTNTAAPVLNGTVAMEVNTASSQNADKLVLTTGTLTYGGTLTVNNTGNWPAPGPATTFDLFDAPAFAGNFSSVTLPSGGSLHWKTNGLTVDGSIMFTNTAPTVPDTTYSRASGASFKVKIADLMSLVSDLDGDTTTYVGYSSANPGVTSDATYIYIPTNNVTESFTYTARDNFGGTNTGTVTININGNLYGNASGNVNLTSTNATALLSGIPGFSYSAQRATNANFTLGVSNFVSVVTAGTNGVISIVDDFADLFGTPNSDRPNEAYYRLKFESQP